jgi:hypothetical protein
LIIHSEFVNRYSIQIANFGNTFRWIDRNGADGLVHSLLLVGVQLLDRSKEGWCRQYLH